MTLEEDLITILRLIDGSKELDRCEGVADARAKHQTLAEKGLGRKPS